MGGRGLGVAGGHVVTPACAGVAHSHIKENRHFKSLQGIMTKLFICGIEHKSLQGLTLYTYTWRFENSLNPAPFVIAQKLSHIHRHLHSEYLHLDA